MGSCSSALDDSVTYETSSSLNIIDIQLIRKSWSPVVQSGLTKYGIEMMIRIFEFNENLKQLWNFGEDLETEEQMRNNSEIKSHAEKLFKTLDMIISLLDDMEKLSFILIKLGYQHYKFGVRDEHFEYIGAILVETLEDGLKEHFTFRIKEAWFKMFSIIENQMKIGFRQCESEMQPENIYQ